MGSFSFGECFLSFGMDVVDWTLERVLFGVAHLFSLYCSRSGGCSFGYGCGGRSLLASGMGQPFPERPMGNVFLHGSQMH